MNQPAIKRLLAEASRHLDGMLLALLIVLLGVSVAVVFSASGQSGARLAGHLTNIAAAMAVLIVVANVPPHILAKLGPPLYVLGLVLLLGVALFGEIRNGSRRWLPLGFTSIQPSELDEDRACPLDAGLVVSSSARRRSGSGISAWPPC